jgi:hypothetical protein
VQPCDEDCDKDDQFSSFFRVMEHQRNEIDRRNRSIRGKTCPSVTLSTANPTWTDPGSKLGLRGEKPATNRLSHGMSSYSLRLIQALTLLLLRLSFQDPEKGAAHSSKSL